MSNVIDINVNKPHFSGTARCLSCKYEWQAVKPEDGDLWMECPECSLHLGRYVHHIERNNKHWQCNCGNDLFSMTPEGAYCPVCGIAQVFSNA